MSQVPSVVLADADAPVRTGMRAALEDDGFDVRGECADAAAALGLTVRLAPDACLIDVALPGGGLDTVAAIAQHRPATSVIVLTDTLDDADLLDAVRNGAVGYLVKDLDPSRLGAVVRGVLDGEAAMSRRTTMHLLRALRGRERGRLLPVRPGARPVSDRELEVLELLASGLATAEVARRLGLSEVTVRRHVFSAVRKLGVGDRDAALDLVRGRSRA